MKIILTLIALLFSLSLLAVEVDVLSADIGIEDEDGRPELCLTVVRHPKTSEVLGIVETKFDCFYARQAKKSSQIKVNHRTLSPVEPSLLQHLQSRDPSLALAFSDGE